MILPGEALDVLESSPNSHLSVLPSSGRTKDRRVPSCRVSVPSLNSAGTVPFQSYVAFGAPAAAEGTRTVARDQQNDDSSLWPPEPDSIYPVKAQEGNRHEAESQLRRRKGRSSQGPSTRAYRESAALPPMSRRASRRRRPAAWLSASLAEESHVSLLGCLKRVTGPRVSSGVKTPTSYRRRPTRRFSGSLIWQSPARLASPRSRRSLGSWRLSEWCSTPSPFSTLRRSPAPMSR